MLKKDSDWNKVEGASLEVLEKLKSISGIQLPVEYFELLAYTNGGEGSLPVNPYYFCLDPAEAVIDHVTDKTFEEFFSGFLVIGGNGGGELIALDTRIESKIPIVALDSNNIDLSESRVLIAENFATFIDLLGCEESEE